MGPCNVHVSSVEAVVEADYPLIHVELSGVTPSPVETAIAENIAGLIEDGSTLQIGAGTIPDAVGRLLANKRDLGVHSELLTDWVLALYEAGAITGKRKTTHPERIVTAMALGSKRVYEFIDNNPLVEMYPISYTNDPELIARNAKQISINATIEIDLMGQCCSESFGPLHHSGTGGQWEFHRGASRSPGGKGIIALNSTARKGTVSRIVPMLAQGAAVTIPRNDIHYVVTEFGSALLKGKTLRQRAEALIGLAHPDFRGELRAEAKRLGYLGSG
jgi:acyl-CoA hydrolase